MNTNIPVTSHPMSDGLDLKGSWIWYPQKRVKANTFIFFRKNFELPEKPEKVTKAWISADSRYQLFVNGQRVQRGPAPFDPRMQDVDPVDLVPYLRQGTNTIGVIVCYFGQGEGTYVPGKPGFIFDAEIVAGGKMVEVQSDASWKTHYGDCWTESDHKRWFLRALQEIFDARLYPHGWLEDSYDDSAWIPAHILDIPSDRPSAYGSEISYYEMSVSQSQRDTYHLTKRAIPPIQETSIKSSRVCDAGWIEWKLPAAHYFDTGVEGAYSEKRDRELFQLANKGKPIALPAIPEGKSLALTFEFDEEYCGHQYVKLTAPAGTVVEMIWCESWKKENLLLTTVPMFSQWARFTCVEGENTFETFDYEACRFLQVLVRNASGPVEILDAGLTRRLYPFAHKAEFECSDDLLNRLHEATLNTLRIVAQENIVDNMFRERQQYCEMGDNKTALYYAFGESRLPANMIRGFARGQSAEGWFLDAFPAWDRLERLWQRFLNLSYWGPILEVGPGFGHDVAKYHLFTGDRSVTEELYGRLLKGDQWLKDRVGPDGLMPSVGHAQHLTFMDHCGFGHDGNKEACLNLYYLGYIRDALGRLATWMGDSDKSRECNERYDSLLAAIRTKYWDTERQLIVDNQPGEPLHLHELTIERSLLYGAVPLDQVKPSLDLLVERPANLGRAHPCHWHHYAWALSKHGIIQPVLDELRQRFGTHPSFLQNKVLPEMWEIEPGTGTAWCQSTLGPVLALYGEVLGVRPLAPGFAVTEFEPKLGDLERIGSTYFTSFGALKVQCRQSSGTVSADLSVPEGMELQIVAKADRTCAVSEAATETTTDTDRAMGKRRWRVASGESRKVSVEV